MNPERPLAWVRLSEIEIRSIRFLDRPFWQAAAFHLLTGRKGVGKGTTLADLAARITLGELGDKRTVLWIGSEDSASVDVKPRVLVAGGDPSRVVVITEWPQFPRDIARLGATIAEPGDVGLVVIDPVGNHITGRNSNSETDIRDALAPLNALADEHDTMIVGVRHLSEKEASNGTLAAILGSSAWVQLPRAVLVLARDDDDPRVSHFQCVAGNRLPPDTPGRSLRLEGVKLDGLEEEVTRAVWLGESTKNVENLIGATTATTRRVPAAEVRALILCELATGPKSRDYLDASARDALGVNPDTVYKSGLDPLRKEGLVKPYKDGVGGPWCWRLTDQT